MTTEDKIKEIEWYYNQAQKLHKDIKSPFKGTFKPEFSASEKEGLDYLEFIMPAIGYVSYALEVIRELQEQRDELTVSKIDNIKKEPLDTLTLLYIALKENATLKAQLDELKHALTMNCDEDLQAKNVIASFNLKRVDIANSIDVVCKVSSLLEAEACIKRLLSSNKQMKAQLDRVKDLSVAHNMSHEPFCDESYWREEFENIKNYILGGEDGK